ncbi:MAG: hypothetical protein O3C40_25140 [Planctomycetota bacterium]|nr:hypothetical protein [Planctomycetota bacterium]
MDAVTTVSVQHGTASQLRQRLAEDPQCQALFDEAMRLWTSLYETDVDKFHLPKLFAGHGHEHFLQVERFLDKLIFVEWADHKNFVPTPEEALLLLSAVWLHDIGLLHGIFPSDPLPDKVDLQKLVATYHDRTAKYLRECWKEFCSWSSFQKNVLGEICLYHRPGRPVDDLQILTHDVHVRKLAALLRVADVCHLSANRMPVDLAQWVDPTFQNGEGAELEILANPQGWVHSVELDRATQSFVIFAQLPKPTDIPAPQEIDLPANDYLPAVTLNFRPFADYLCDGVQSVLNEVSRVLGECPNCAFKHVRLQFEMYGSLGTAEEHVADMWPSLLAGTRCGGEAASMTAVILRSLILQEKEGIPKSGLLRVLNWAMRLHPWNALVQRFNDGMQTRLASLTNDPAVGTATERDIVLKYLGQFLNDRVHACRTVAAKARPVLNDVDVVLIYGYSKTVMTLLARTQPKFEGKVLAVRVDAATNNRWVKYDDERVQEELERAGVRFEFVEGLTLETRLQWLKRARERVKVLLGTKAILANGDAVALAGNRTVAVLAKEADFPVIVLAEDDKSHLNSGRDAAIRRAVEASQDPGIVTEHVELLNKDRHYDELIGTETDLTTASPDDQEG